MAPPPAAHPTIHLILLRLSGVSHPEPAFLEAPLPLLRQYFDCLPVQLSQLPPGLEYQCSTLEECSDAQQRRQATPQHAQNTADKYELHRADAPE